MLLSGRGKEKLSPSARACGYVLSLSHVLLFVIPWTVACQGPLSMGFSRTEYWSGLLFPPPGNLPNAGIKPLSPKAGSCIAG